MPRKPNKKQNLNLIKNRLAIGNLPTKFKLLPANTIAIFAQNPDLDLAIRVIIEQNNTIKSANGRRLAAENKVQVFLNPSKSEIVQLWNKLFKKATKSDDKVLSEIGAISKQTALEDLEKAEQIIEEAEHINKQYVKKYGQL